MVYYLVMASIIGKRQGNQTYYYLVESARVDGKPRIVSQQYLGSSVEVMARLAGSSAGEPVRTQHKSFGDVAAVWSVLERLDVAAVIDAAPPRRSPRPQPDAPSPTTPPPHRRSSCAGCGPAHPPRNRPVSPSPRPSCPGTAERRSAACRPPAPTPPGSSTSGCPAVSR